MLFDELVSIVVKYSDAHAELRIFRKRNFERKHDKDVEDIRCRHQCCCKIMSENDELDVLANILQFKKLV